MSAIGEYINNARQEQQISIRYLAKLTGVSHSEINKIENGERANPSPLHLKSIASALGLNQIDCLRKAGYIDDEVHETPSGFLSECSPDEIEQLKSYAEFLHTQQKPEQKEEVQTMGNGLKVASLFAGIGGICYGFKQAGAEIVWANEIDKDACKTYRHNFGGDYLVEGDIKEVDPNDIPDIDILNGGFPCQAFSVAGYRKGFDDERGNLFFEITRILEIKRPRAVLLENVKNLEGHDKGNTFKVIKEQLELLGYHVHHKVLNTMEYGNVPQNRERIYIVAFLSEEAYNKFEYPQAIELTRNIHDVIDVTDKKPLGLYYENSKYYPELKKTMTRKDTVYQWRRVYCRENKSNVCPTLTANMGTGGHNVPLILDDFGIRKLTPEECVGFQGFPETFSFPDDISNASKYKQAGNSVSVPVIKRIAENIVKALS
ncbi:MAG: DNA (cytosine-5-)-methyltransferase [Prevotellaceae bacterium]|nr:DNA (cytosine-5-)-methyltransferase [Prevotellaceae bacterium]